jgi:hypothetical protein
VRKGNTNTANYQHGKIPCQEREHMAGDKHNKQTDQQFSALHLTGKQHEGERHQGNNPGVDRQHDPDLSGLHIEALCDVGKQTDRDKLCGIENKTGNGKRNYP